MNKNIEKAICQAEEIVKRSKVSNEFSPSAFKIVLAYLLHNNKTSASLSSENVKVPIDSKSGEHKQNSWKEHLEDKQPKNDYEIIALIVEWLTGNEKPSVKKEEIVEFIRENPDRITNVEKVEDIINHTKSNKAYGYIEFVNKKDDKTYRLSIKGKQLVNRLPDRGEIAKKKPRKK